MIVIVGNTPGWYGTTAPTLFTVMQSDLASCRSILLDFVNGEGGGHGPAAPLPPGERIEIISSLIFNVLIKERTATCPGVTGPGKITFYVECACGHPTGWRMTAAQAAMTPDGLIPYDGLCFKCSAADFAPQGGAR